MRGVWLVPCPALCGKQATGAVCSKPAVVSTTVPVLSMLLPKLKYDRICGSEGEIGVRGEGRAINKLLAQWELDNGLTSVSEAMNALIPCGGPSPHKMCTHSHCWCEC